MKHIILLAFWVLTASLLHAQNREPEKYTDALKRYQQFVDGLPKDDNSKEHDGPEALFNRWAWYWKQHTDENGYMVPTAKNLEEWLKYTAIKANKSNERTTSGANWIFQGPHAQYSSQGRTNVIAFDPTDSNTFYAGAAGGGVWKTTDGGATWASLYDNLPSLGVADIKINPLNHNTIYVLTGDGDAWDSYSTGLIVSHDGGTTWSTTGLSWTLSFYNRGMSLLINPQDTNKLMIGTASGLYKSSDCGATWTRTDGHSFKQILYNPADTNIVYGTTYNTANIIGSTGAVVMRSANGGTHWDTVFNPANAQRIALAVCPAAPNIVKAVASNTSSGLKGIYSSADSGRTFTALYVSDPSCTDNLLGWNITLPSTGCGGQGWYDLAIAMHPSNPLQVTLAGVFDYYSTDGGVSWNGMAPIHADKHFLGYNPRSGALFQTCDGGVMKNYGPAEGWIDLSDGLYITEFYKNAVDNGVPFCIGGAQDNGSTMLNGSSETFLTGGDGFQPLIDYSDPYNTFFTSYEYGNVFITTDGGSTFNSITNSISTSETNWLTPFVQHPNQPQVLLLAFKQIFQSYDRGASWRTFSPVFNANDYITNLAIATSSPDHIYATYDDYYTTGGSIIEYTTNSGTSWNMVTPPFTGIYITGLAIDPANPNRISVTFGGYAAAAKVLSYDITAGSWLNETGGLPNVPANCIIADTGTYTRYIGTDVGVYYKNTSMTNWALYSTHLPTVHVTDLHINYATGELWAATFGRGMWKSVKADFGTHAVPHTGVPTTLRETADISVAPNPAHGSFRINTPSPALRDGTVAVSLINAAGKTILRNTGEFDIHGNMKVDIKQLPAGFYICEVSNERGVARNKLVVY
jgi:photosystem II stability/assembly factor-like uncharacterized protein